MRNSVWEANGFPYSEWLWNEFSDILYNNISGAFWEKIAVLNLNPKGQALSFPANGDFNLFFAEPLVHEGGGRAAAHSVFITRIYIKIYIWFNIIAGKTMSVNTLASISVAPDGRNNWPGSATGLLIETKNSHTDGG